MTGSAPRPPPHPTPSSAVVDEHAPITAVMSGPVTPARPDARLAEAARLMRELHVAGLPVVGSSGQVVGVVSEKDLVRGVHRATGVASPRGLLDLLLESAPPKGRSLFEVARRTLENGYVRDVMSMPAIVIGPTATVGDAAARMRQYGIHRLPIVNDRGALVGIVTQQDIGNAVGAVPPKRARGALRPRPSRATAGGTADAFLDI